MHGKSLRYLQQMLIERGFDVPFICCEDWGWWVEVKVASFEFCVFADCGPNQDFPLEFACTDGTVGEKISSWKQFPCLGTTPWVKSLHQNLITLFLAGEETQIVNLTDKPSC